MRDRIGLAFIVAAATLALIARATGSEGPLFTAEDGGRTFVYHSRPGDRPSGVATMFGIPPNDLPAFLAANGISDPTRVASGFVYHIPNAAARELSDRVGALERDNARLTRALSEAAERSEALTKETRQARESAAAAEARATRLANAERWWLTAQVLIVLLVLALGATVALAVAAVRRQRQAERFARTLAHELEEKRKVALAERQESGRRILELETKQKELESKLGPRVVVSGRSG
ncbi:MAG: hypothetical protein E6J75_08865 [Deltaproteobacteria bacterium]|nr:MAG: hypothetical protein E6J79_02610 [Deltaproteobacteria bacterium]TMA56868.1 MAG: hypothetical protein E6J75_08865 [Deltaproteobacteria bacterium]